MTTFVAGDPATRNLQRIALRVTEWTRVRPWDSTQGSPLVGLSLGEDPRVIAMAETLSRAGVVTITELRAGLEITTGSYVGRVVIGPIDLTIVP